MNRHVKSNVIAAIVLTVALAFFSSLSFAQEQGEKSTKSQNPSRNGAQKEQSKGGPQEGIKVHGHWTIVIKNPDGSLASKTEFENALVQSSTMLGDLLGRAAVTGRWNVVLFAAACVAQDGSGVAVPCDIEEPGGGNCQPDSCQSFNNLTVSSANGKAILQGTATATFAASIPSVVSYVSECPRTGSSNYGLPAVCGNTPTSNASIFSNATLKTPVSVLAGQIIQVTVTFSFS